MGLITYAAKTSVEAIAINECFQWIPKTHQENHYHSSTTTETKFPLKMENTENQPIVAAEAVQPTEEIQQTTAEADQQVETVQPVEETQKTTAEEKPETSKPPREIVHSGEPEIVTHVGVEVIHRLVDKFEHEEVFDYPHAVHVDSQGEILTNEQLEKRHLASGSHHQQPAAEPAEPTEL